MPRSIWTGSLSFGLVNIPVKLFTAIHEERVAFHLLHDQDKVRLKQKMICPDDGTEVHREHMVKGYEISPDKYVIVRDEEIEAVAPKSSRVIELQDFVDLAAIDPVYFDKPYYLAPQQHAEKSYALLVEAMAKTGKVGIAKFTMRSKEYLAALRPVDRVIVLETMHFANEVTKAKDIEEAPRDVKLDAREISMAEKLIEGLSTKFHPSAYHDEYRERIMELIKKKSHGETVSTHKDTGEKQTRTTDLMAALEASLAKAHKQKSAVVDTPSSGKRVAGKINGHSHHAAPRKRKSA